ncbi:MAG: hypothetical protein Kow0037_09740 [Calditrichia bacterium]
MKKQVFITLIALLAFLLAAGCEKDAGSPLSDEQLEIDGRMELLTDDNTSDESADYLVDWGIDDGSEDNMYDGFSTFSPDITFSKVMSPIQNVVRFGRKINKRNRRQIQIINTGNDTIYYSIKRQLVGRFVIFENLGNDTAQVDTIAIHRKDLQHIVQRKAVFVKRQPNDEAFKNPRKRWKLAAVSIGFGESHPTRTVNLEKVMILTSNGDSLSFSDPLNTMLRIPEDIPKFLPGESVTIRVLVSNSSGNLVPNPETGATETVLLHFGVNRHHRARKRFEFKGTDPATGYNIYEGTWVVHEPVNRAFHAVVDVIDNGTIYDTDQTTYPYNSVTWGCPYRVVFSE